MITPAETLISRQIVESMSLFVGDRKTGLFFDSPNGLRRYTFSESGASSFITLSNINYYPGKKDRNREIIDVAEKITETGHVLSVSVQVLDNYAGNSGDTHEITYIDKNGGVREKGTFHIGPDLRPDKEGFRQSFTDIPISDLCLPESICVRETVIAFIDQIKARNFDMPKLVLP